MGNKWPVLFVKKPLGKGDLLPAHKILIERPGDYEQHLGMIDSVKEFKEKRKN